MRARLLPRCAPPPAPCRASRASAAAAAALRASGSRAASALTAASAATVSLGDGVLNPLLPPLSLVPAHSSRSLCAKPRLGVDQDYPAKE